MGVAVAESAAAMRFGSVCSGIEAASVAFAPLGWKAAWLAEIDAFASAVLAHHYPGVPNLGDMTTLAARIDAGEVEAPDGLWGGTPCQAFSVAGLRRSLDDARGNLSLEFIRIADAIDRVRRAAGKPPAWIGWENVPGVLSTKDNAFGAFLGGLCGCDAAIPAPADGWPSAGVVAGPSRVVAWRVLDAQFFGVAQRRKRVFVLALGGPGAWACADALLPVGDRMLWHPAPSREAGQRAARPIAAGSPHGSGYRNDADTADNLVAGTLGCRSADHPSGLKSESDFIVAAFGGNNTGGAIDVAAGLNAKGGAGRMDFDSETFVTHSLRGEGFDASEDGTGRGTPLIPIDMRQASRGATMTNNRAEGTSGGAPGTGIGSDGDPSPTISTSHTPAIAFDCKSSGQNGFGVREELAGTQRAMAHSNSHTNGGGHQAVMTGMQVRRLTPRECERLQGFPDDYTLVPHGTNRAKDFREWLEYLRLRIAGLTEDDARRLAADGPRYQALGYSWAVPCARWVGQRINDVRRVA
jgi:DNA (cytosine-5)-methyltransferase 1